jgi:hypothetical protein
MLSIARLLAGGTSGRQYGGIWLALVAGLALGWLAAAQF